MEDKSKQPHPAVIVPADKAPTAPLISEREDDVTEGAVTPFEGDYMQVTIEVAEHLEKYEKALNAIMNFIVKRTYAGDWVSHDKTSTPIEERTVNMTGAAAERIARDLGIQESERTQPEKIMEPKHPGHYRYECVGKFTFRGRTVEAKGIATTLNPFYSKFGENSRKPEDIREEYIVRDAWRDCTKQGVKGLFGLRKIPVMKLKELGFDIDKVKYVNFKEGGKGGANDQSATAKPAQAKEILETAVVIKVLSPRTYNNSDIIDVITDKNEKFSWWGKSLKSPEGKQLDEWRKGEYLVTLKYSVKGNYKNIEGLGEAQPL